MISFRVAVVLITLVPVLLGGECEKNPRKPKQVTFQQMQGPEYETFFEQFDGPKLSGAMLYTKQTPNGLQAAGGKGAACALVEVDEEEKVIGVYYDPNEKNVPPPMQLQLLAKVELEGEESGSFRGDYANPQILCDLDAEQCKYAIENGIPKSLIEAILEEAKDEDWHRLNLPYEYSRYIIVDPDAHFPEKEAAEEEEQQNDGHEQSEADRSAAADAESTDQ